MCDSHGYIRKSCDLRKKIMAVGLMLRNNLEKKQDEVNLTRKLFGLVCVGHLERLLERWASREAACMFCVVRGVYKLNIVKGGSSN